MKRRLTEYHFDGLIALTLFGVFAVCVLIVLLTGANAYRRLVVRGDEVIDRNACVQYISTRVRQAANPKEVAIEDFGEGNALVLPDKNGYGTRVYYYDGYIMELYADTSLSLHPRDGERIMESQGVEMALDDGLLSVTAIDSEGESTSMVLSLQAEGRDADEE